jgi:hypothetical protein
VQRDFSREYRGRSVEVTTHLHLVPRSRMVELYLHCPLYLNGLALNYLSTGTTLPSYLNEIPDRKEITGGRLNYLYEELLISTCLPSKLDIIRVIQSRKMRWA